MPGPWTPFLGTIGPAHLRLVQSMGQKYGQDILPFRVCWLGYFNHLLFSCLNLLSTEVPQNNKWPQNRPDSEIYFLLAVWL